MGKGWEGCKNAHGSRRWRVVARVLSSSRLVVSVVAGIAVSVVVGYWVVIDE